MFPSLAWAVELNSALWSHLEVTVTLSHMSFAAISVHLMQLGKKFYNSTSSCSRPMCELGTLVPACNLSTQEAEAGGSRV
jgi:hypothetical protein